MGDSADMQTEGSAGRGESVGWAGDGRMAAGRGGASGGGRMRWSRDGMADSGGGGGGAMMGRGGGGAMTGRAGGGAAAAWGGRRWEGEPVSFWTTSRKSDLSML